MSKEKLQAGDTVTLASQPSPVMTIENIDEETGSALVIYGDKNGNLKKEQVQVAALRQYDPDSDEPGPIVF